MRFRSGNNIALRVSASVSHQNQRGGESVNPLEREPFLHFSTPALLPRALVALGRQNIIQHSLPRPVGGAIRTQLRPTQDSPAQGTACALRAPPRVVEAVKKLWCSAVCARTAPQRLPADCARTAQTRLAVLAATLLNGLTDTPC